MTEHSNTRSPRWEAILSAGALVAISVALVVVAYRALFGSFEMQDDEGYLLLSMRMFNAGGALYDQVYSQYGPGFYAIFGEILRILQVPLTSDGARFVNLTLWISSSLLVGLVLLAFTRRLLVGVTGLLVAFLVLHVDANEPMHPGSLIGFLLVLLVAIAVFLVPSRRSLAMVLIGACAALLLAVKANVGGLAFVSIAVACAFTVPVLRNRRAIPVVVAAVFVVAPVILLSKHLDTPSIWHLAAIASLSGIALVCVLSRNPTADDFEVRDLWMGALGALVVLAIAILLVLAQGTTLSGLVDGAVVKPASTPSIQFAPPIIAGTSVVWALVALLAALVWRQWLQGRSFRSATELALGGIRLVAGVLIWAALTGEVMEAPMVLTSGLMIGAPLAWLSAVPDRLSPATSFVRALIPALAILQILHGYPVPGSQFGWAQLPLVLVGGICVGDGLGQVTAAAAAFAPGRRVWSMVASVFVLLFGAWLAVKPLHRYSDEVALAYRSGVPLDLPGAGRLRLPPAQAEQLRSVTRALNAECRTFLTMPGLNSFYLWTGETAPVEMSGPWEYFLSSDDQRRIVERVARTPGLCVVRSDAAAAVWFFSTGHNPPVRLLVQFIDSNFTTAATFGGNGPIVYELMVRTQR